MQQFLLNDKVITEIHMKIVDLKQRTRYAKKYDMPSTRPTQVFTQRNLIQSLLQKQRKVLVKPKNDESVAQKSPKSKHLLSTLRSGELFLTSDQKNSEHKTFIKENCFKIKGIKKCANDATTGTKIMNRTCSLVSANRFTDSQVAPYDVNSDIRFKRSPQWSICPKTNRVTKKDQRKFDKIDDKQNLSPERKDRQHNRASKQKQTMSKMTIKQMVDKEIQEQIKKRRAICRTAPIKHLDKLNVRQELSTECGFGEDDVCKVEAKIYSDMRENRQKAQRRNKQRIGINISKNKPFTSCQINKNTVKILKKYNCDNMVYFSKFINKD